MPIAKPCCTTMTRIAISRISSFRPLGGRMSMRCTPFHLRSRGYASSSASQCPASFATNGGATCSRTMRELHRAPIRWRPPSSTRSIASACRAAPLIALIDARGFDLYDDPMPDMSTLETYCRETSSLLFRWVGEILGGGGPQPASPAAHEAHRNCPDASAASPVLLAAADHAGLAYAFTGLIRAFALHAARGQLYIPGDLLHRHGSSPEEALNGRATPALLASIGEWRAEARRHLAEAQASVRNLEKAIVPAFLPLVLVEPYLRATEERSYDPFRSPIEIPQWRRQWRLWRGLPTPPRSKS